MYQKYLRVDPKFKRRLMGTLGGGTFRLCYQCGVCTAICPATGFIEVFRPNKIIELAKLGIRSHAYSKGFWLCAACNTCVKNCPQRVDVAGIMHALKTLAIKEGEKPKFLTNGFEETLREVPFPVVYSWLCLNPRLDSSKRCEYDDFVLEAIQKILDRRREVKALPKTHKETVAVIGSGPAGLTAAWELVNAGYPVTVFESLPEPGGMLRVGIPDYRLPKEILDEEIRYIKGLGIEIRTDSTVNKDRFNEIREEYDVVFIATGAHKGRKLNVEGEDLEGVIHALDFMRQVNLEGRARIRGKVIVIGGGGVAVDAARTALRSGAESVQLVCLESREEMPAHEWEVREALTEGVTLHTSWGTKRILGGRRVYGVEFVRCTSVFDEKGRFNPSFDETETKVLEADTVILAIGQTPDLSFIEDEIEVDRGVIKVNPITMETSLPGVFAGGDVVSGSASVVEAIEAGKIAATSIDRYLTGK